LKSDDKQQEDKEPDAGAVSSQARRSTRRTVAQNEHRTGKSALAVVQASAQSSGDDSATCRGKRQKRKK